jgi:hypothetical protein
MSALQAVRCRVGWHRYGPVLGDDRGGHQTCTYCQHRRVLRTDQPPQTHDHLDF